MSGRDDRAALEELIESQPRNYLADAIIAAGWVPCHVVLAACERATRTLAAEANAQINVLTATLDRVRWLAELPDPQNPDAYQHYAVPIDDRVEMGVLVDDLRAALTPPP